MEWLRKLNRIDLIEAPGGNEKNLEEWLRRNAGWVDWHFSELKKKHSIKDKTLSNYRNVLKAISSNIYVKLLQQAIEETKNKKSKEIYVRRLNEFRRTK